MGEASLAPAVTRRLLDRMAEDPTGDGGQRIRRLLSTREVDVLENGPNPVRECLYTVFEEEFEHNRYAVRDLAHFE